MLIFLSAERPQSVPPAGTREYGESHIRLFGYRLINYSDSYLLSLLLQADNCRSLSPGPWLLEETLNTYSVPDSDLPTIQLYIRFAANPDLQ